MKNKKLIVSLLVVVMVLSMLVTCLVACNKDDMKEISAETLAEKFDYAIANMENSGLLNNFELAADLGVKATYGSDTFNYNIAFAAKLALANDDNTNAASFVVTDSSKNVVLGAYYDEAYSGSDVYLVAGDKKLQLKGLNVKDVMKEEDKFVTDEQSEDIAGLITDGISDYFVEYVIMMAGNLGTVKMNDAGTKARLELPLTALLKDTSEEGLGGTVATLGAPIIDPYLKKLGISQDLMTIINDVLPNISVALEFTFSGSGDSTQLTGIKAELAAGKKDMVIKKTNGETLLQINIAQDLKAEVSGNIYLNPTTSKIQYPAGGYEGYEKVNALNVKATGTVTINQDVKKTIDLGAIDLNLNIPKGSYNITFAIDADPTKLIGMSFNSGSTHETLDIVGNTLNEALDYFLIDVAKADGSGSLIKIELTDKGGEVKITALEVGALGIEGLDAMANQNLSALIKFIKPLIPNTIYPDKNDDDNTSTDVSGDVNSGDTTTSGETTPSGETGSGDQEKTNETLATIKEYIDNLSIILSNGVLSAELKNTTISNTANIFGKDLVIGAKISVDSTGVTINATITNLLAEDQSFTADIKFTSIELGAARE